MRIVLGCFLFLILLYISANITSGIINDSLDNTELELIRLQEGEEAKRIYLGLQYVCLIFAIILTIMVILNFYYSNVIRYKILLFSMIITSFILFSTTAVQYHYVNKIDLQRAVQEEPGKKYKTLTADCPRFNIDFAIISVIFTPIIYLAYNINNNNKLKLFEGVKKTTKKKKSDLDRIIDEESK